MSGDEFFSSEGKDVPDKLSGFETDEDIYGSDQNYDGSAASIESAQDLSFDPAIEAEIAERAEEIRPRHSGPIRGRRLSDRRTRRSRTRRCLPPRARRLLR